jgi:hypothetical protein
MGQAPLLLASVLLAGGGGKSPPRPSEPPPVEVRFTAQWPVARCTVSELEYSADTELLALEAQDGRRVPIVTEEPGSGSMRAALATFGPEVEQVTFRLPGPREPVDVSLSASCEDGATSLEWWCENGTCRLSSARYPLPASPPGEGPQDESGICAGKPAPDRVRAFARAMLVWGDRLVAAACPPDRCSPALDRAREGFGAASGLRHWWVLDPTAHSQGVTGGFGGEVWGIPLVAGRTHAAVTCQDGDETGGLGHPRSVGIRLQLDGTTYDLGGGSNGVYLSRQGTGHEGLISWEDSLTLGAGALRVR